MKRTVFLSWAGEHSHRVAQAFHAWLPDIIQQVDPWISSNDIDKGAAWLDGIRSALVKSNGLGLFLLTREALESKWLMFEAGSVANMGDGRVCSVCIDVKAREIPQPLSLYQKTDLNEPDVFRLLKTVNGYGDAQLIPDALLKRAFERMWPELQTALDKIAQQRTAFEPAPAEPVETPEQAQLDRVLELVSTLNDRLASVERAQFNQTLEKEPSLLLQGVDLDALTRAVNATNASQRGLNNPWTIQVRPGGAGLLGLPPRRLLDEDAGNPEAPPT